ncbi:hypothetical protein GCM10010518_06700 [Kitasatospora cinereorecta]
MGEGVQHRVVTTELDTLVTALYVHVDHRLKTPRWRGRPPRLTDAELVTLDVAKAVLGFHGEARPGCASPMPICGPCFRIRPSARLTTSVSGPHCRWCRRTRERGSGKILVVGDHLAAGFGRSA